VQPVERRANAHRWIRHVPVSGRDQCRHARDGERGLDRSFLKDGCCSEHALRGGVGDAMPGEAERRAARARPYELCITVRVRGSALCAGRLGGRGRRAESGIVGATAKARAGAEAVLSLAPAPQPSSHPPAAGLICRVHDRHCPIGHIEWRTASTICASTARRGRGPSADERRTPWPTT
jgi:hypothetical protein